MRSGTISTCGKTYDMRKRLHRFAYWWHRLRHDKPRDVCWWLADYLSRVACWLRGHRWYAVHEEWPGVYGNRVADLRNQIWTASVLIADLHDESDNDHLSVIDRHLTELAQMAGENWGHIE